MGSRREVLCPATSFKSLHFFAFSFKEHQLLMIAVTISDYPFQANKKRREAFAGSSPPRAKQQLRVSLRSAPRKQKKI